MACKELGKLAIATDKEEEELLEPASPTTRYLNSSVLSLAILAVFESEIPIDDSNAVALLRNRFLPVNNRFSSILITDKKGVQRWKKVEVVLEDHVKVPMFPPDLSIDSYEECFQEYISTISMEKLCESRPLWEIHLFKYPTSSGAEGTIVMKLHHALGDGFSLMGALFSCLKRADDPSLSLTFPASSSSSGKEETGRSVGGGRNDKSCRFKMMGRNLVGFWNTVSDTAWSLMKSTVMADDVSPIRSENSRSVPKPISIATVTLPLDQLFQFKLKVTGTVNDVITGMIFHGIHLYNQRMKCSGAKKMTTLVLLNTRMVKGYKSVNDMSEAKSWGNRFTFLQIPVPSCSDVETSTPSDFILRARRIIKKKRNSMGFVVISRLLNLLEKIKSPEAVSRYIFSTIQNSSMGISNIIGPLEKIEIGGYPVKNFYFIVAGMPQSLAITLMSYMGKMTVVVAAEKGFIHSHLLVSCIHKSFQKMQQEISSI